ncbi:MAG: hypothetical protein ACJA01_002154 [Saprospiraceae bacterium]|jgi:hypothetical protein
MILFRQSINTKISLQYEGHLRAETNQLRPES